MAPPPLNLTRAHLNAFAALSLALGVLCFFLGVQVGRRQAPPAAVAPAPQVVDRNVRDGDLEGLLARVDQKEATQLGFPADLRQPTAPSASDGVPTSGFALQVGDFDTAERAEKQLETLRSAGLSAYRVAAVVDGRTLHRVRVGGYPSQEAASAAAAGVATRSGVERVSVVPAP